MWSCENLKNLQVPKFVPPEIGCVAMNLRCVPPPPNQTAISSSIHSGKFGNAGFVSLLGPLHISVGILQPSFTAALTSWTTTFTFEKLRKVKGMKRLASAHAMNLFKKEKKTPKKSQVSKISWSLHPSFHHAWLALMLWSSALWRSRYLQPFWQHNPTATAARLGRRTQLILGHKISTAALAEGGSVPPVDPNETWCFGTFLHMFFEKKSLYTL